jgi:hypothetical protein
MPALHPENHPIFDFLQAFRFWKKRRQGALIFSP